MHDCNKFARVTPSRVCTAALLVTLSLAAVVVARNKPKDPSGTDDQKRAVHALDRLTFGPRPGDVATVTAMGVDKWIELQLYPDKIDDSAMQFRLAQYRTLQMTPREIATNFPPNPLLKAAMEGKVAIPNDPYRYAIYMAGIARLQNQQEAKQNASKTTDDQSTATLKPASQGNTALQERKQDKRDAHDQIDALIQLSPEARMQRILSLPALQQAELLKDVPVPKKQTLLGASRARRTAG